MSDTRIWNALDFLPAVLRELRECKLRIPEVMLLTALEDCQVYGHPKDLLNRIFELADACRAVAMVVEHYNHPEISKRIADAALELERSTAQEWSRIDDGAVECTPKTCERIEALKNDGLVT